MSEKNGNRRKQTPRRRRNTRARRRRQLLVNLMLLILVAAAVVFVMPRLFRVGHTTETQHADTAQSGQTGGQEAAAVDIADDAEQSQVSQADAAGEAAADEPAAADANEDGSGAEAAQAAEAGAENAGSESLEAAIAHADRMAAGYDYDGAIAYLQARDDASDSAAAEAVQRYETEKASCVAVDVTTVPHIFYHSLVNDPSAAFNASVLGQFAADGMNAWMTTVEEFDKITQKLYDNGYVYVRLRDLVNQTEDENGNVHFTPRTDLMLPEGKKAIVLSVDDLSYYHSYEAASFPDKLVLDENGKVKCHYVKPDGSESIGDYDVVPRLNTFLEEHPDGAYHGARGLIALTGYNGVFGYRTDIDYEAREHLMADQAKWLEEHPDFNRQDEIEQATVIANAIKEEGWEFASHTWGHLSVTEKSAEALIADNDKWVNNVQNIVGKTDTIIFAHGNDIGDWTPYSSDNAKYAALKNAGYNFYCNVDGSTPYWVQINDTNVRQGRINLDGYMLYQASTGQTTTIDNLFKASEVFDQSRPTPVVANGQG